MRTQLFRTKRFIVLFAALLAALILAAAVATFRFFGDGAEGRVLAGSLAVLAVLPPVIAWLLFGELGKCRIELEQYSTRDPLTGLYNQNTFWDLLEYETQRSLRQQYKFSLLAIDIDNFKVINDTYGHEVGDSFIRDFSAILKTAVRRGDIAARYGGDNFTAILPVCDEEQAYVVAKRVMDGLRGYTLRLPGGAGVQETASIGVAVFPSHAKNAQDLFLLADSMLNQSKSAGKDHVSFPSEHDDVAALRNLGEKNLMVLDALAGRGKKIVPYFQPIVSSADGAVMAYEVLTRIAGPDGVIAAAEFIEAAENMGAIGKIDYQLIEQAFMAVRERDFRGTLFLNLSPKAMVIKDFMPTVRSLFRRFGIDPHSMVFEITERETVKNLQLFEAFVTQLRSEGFRFAIDDFGAGYSSFQYLKSFSIEFLKVDGLFIRNLISPGAIERDIVSSISDLANRLKIKTIAEYVETEAILTEVRAAGIDFAQGYHIRRPSPDLV